MKYHLIHIDLTNYCNVIGSYNKEFNQKNRPSNIITSRLFERIRRFAHITSLNQGARTLNQVLNDDKILEEYYYNVL